jgi:hypothetical protein
MAITTQDGLVAAVAAGQSTILHRTAQRTTVAGGWYQTLDLAGNPGAGVLAGTSTAAGVVPTDATAGCPTINAFTGANTGYLSAIDFGGNVAGRLRLCDMLFKAGAYNFNSNVTLASQPSYSGRLPGSDYKGTEIWIECVTAFTGNLTVTITYTNQDGTTGKSTSLATGTALTVGRMMQVPLASGDTGVQKIESVVGSVASAGTFNVLVLRPLWTGRVNIGASGGTHGPDLTDLPVVFTDSALITQLCMDSTTSMAFELNFGIVNG